MKFNYFYIICIVGIALFTLSCSKMNDLHQPYLDEGEIIYAAKVDSVAPYAGKNRIQLKLFILSQRIEAVRIFWNDYKDSSDVQVGNTTGSLIKILDKNMAEKSYIFKLVSFDKFGNRSLPFEVTGSVYGDRFQSMLSNRIIKSQTKPDNGKVTITWLSTVDKGIRCDLNYTSTSGRVVTMKVPMTQTSTVITDLASDLKYRTLFLPETTAIDTFYTDFKSVVF